ncbi:unnamed protein product [Amoebophrya sp. A120]|nr:unnamed protein product [Amoebophrya sp. A120]|eukprot:GSA120T00005550001.1
MADNESDASAQRKKEEAAEDAEIEKMAQSQASSDKLVSEPIIFHGGVLEHDYWLLYEFCGMIARLFIMGYVGSEAEDRFAKKPGEPYSSFHHDRTKWWVHVTFFALFLIDIGMRSWCAGFWNHLKDEINLLEFFITMGSFFYLCIFLTTSLYINAAGFWHVFGVLPMLRPWVRATNFVILYHKRMLQQGKTTVFTSLVLMSRGIGDSLKTLLWVFVVVFLLMYVMGILMVLQVGQNDEEYNNYYLKTGWDHEEYFANVLLACFTMFQVVTRDKWSEQITRHIGELQPWAFIIVPCFMMVTTYGFMSMIIGIIVNSILQLQEENSSVQNKKDAKAKKILIELLKDAFAKLDEDGSGSLSLDELKNAVEHPELRARLDSIGFPVDSPEDFFTMVDTDNSGEVEADEFIIACSRLKGPCLSRDMLDAETQIDKLGRLLVQIEDKVLESGEKISKLDRICMGVVAQADSLMKEMHRKQKSGEMLPRPNVLGDDHVSLSHQPPSPMLDKHELRGPLPPTLEERRAMRTRKKLTQSSQSFL